MGFGSAARDAKDGADLVIGLSLRQPEKDVALTLRQFPTGRLPEPVVKFSFAGKRARLLRLLLVSKLQSVLRPRDMRQQQVEHCAVPLREVVLATMQAH
jgi:hypothetical protein